MRFGKEPPASRYPTLANGDLVQPNSQALRWPNIPGAPAPDGKLNIFLDQDFGRTFRHEDLTGTITRQPPRIRRIISALVPRLDQDGNEIAGIPSVHLQVPLGTYTGWNVETVGVSKGKGCAFEAGFIPFARTKAERQVNGDPRLSLEERYRDHAGFVASVRRAAERQVREGWLLSDDAAQIVQNAESSTVLK